MNPLCPFCGGGVLEWVAELFYWCADCRHVIEETLLDE